MLIDATHAEETRVVVVDGNKVEEFDFESESKRQLAGNIYLAKVTRVEPSLQAAFVDYGGNRHGFLAFSEIHPDYYQIPVADREALMEEERAYAEAQRSRDEDDEVEDDGEAEPAPKKSRSRSRSRSSSSKTQAAKVTSDDPTQSKEPGSKDEGESREISGMETIDLGAEDGDAAELVSDTPAEVTPEATLEAAPEEMPAAESETVAAETAPDATVAAEVPAEEVPAGEAPVEAAAETEETLAEVAVEEDAPAEVSEDASSESAEEAPAAEAVNGDASDASADSPDEAEEDDGNGRRSVSRSRKRRNDAASKDDTIEAVSDDDDQEDIRPTRKPRPRRYKIQEVIKVRQILLVQVVKEERGNKGAALTTYLSLAGRYCVLMPNTARGGGISRKITNAVDRKKLKEIAAEIDVPKGAGLIVRTAGAKRTKAEIKRDYEYLQRLWEQIRELTLKSIAPAKIYEEGDLIKRSIRDLYNREIDEVFVEGERGYRNAKDFMKMIMPSHAKNVKQYTDPLPLFARYQVESYLAAMFNPTVQLKSGGYIVIGVTEALVAIDVNSGKATKEASIEETALKTNLEAADEVARQLRLRDLAGLIVIDFIDMDERKNNAAVEKRMKDRLKSDRARIQVGRISGFGLMEMSRQRLRPGMLEATTQPCSHCHGTGLIRSDDNMALSILRQIEEEGVRGRSREVLVRCPVGISNFLMNAKREHIEHIEMRYGMAVRVEGDPHLVSPDFEMEKFKQATRSVPVPSAPVVSVNTAQFDPEEPEIEEIEEEQDVAETQETDTDTDTDTDNDVDNGSDDQPKKKKRRRRRRGRSNKNGDRQNDENGDDDGNDNDSDGSDDDDAPAEAAQTAVEETAAEEIAAKEAVVETTAADSADSEAAPAEAAPAQAEAEAAEEEPKPKPRRRASRSSSRKKKDAEAEAEPAPVEAEAADTPAAGVAEAEAAPAIAEAAPVVVAAEAVKAEDASAAEETVAVEAVVEEAVAEAPVAEEPATDAAEEPVAEVQPAAEAETTEAETEETETAETETAEAETAEPETVAAEPANDEPAKPKRRGWWSLG